MSTEDQSVRELAEDLDELARRLEEGPSGWLIEPLLDLALAQIAPRPSDRACRAGGALLGIIYGNPPDISRMALIKEIRRVVAAMRDALAAEPA